MFYFFFFSSRRRHTRYIGDWSSDVCSSDLDANGTPLAGVSVSVKGGKRGTTTGPDGTFRISAPSGAVLVFTNVGYTDKRSEERSVGKECKTRWDTITQTKTNIISHNLHQPE